MFNLFKTKQNYFVGVDFGTSVIKIVELSLKKEQIYLENYGWVDLGLIPGSENSDFSSQVPFDVKAKILLSGLIKKLKLTSKEAHVSLPGFVGLISLISFPEMKKEEVEKAIQFEAHKYIPTPLDDVSLSWDVIKKEEKKILPGQQPEPSAAGKMQVLLVAAPKKEIRKYSDLFNGSGLSIKVIELETFSLARSLVTDNVGTFLIIDIGSRTTNLILTEKGMVLASRSIDAGGNEITNTLAEGLNVSKARAEVMKKQKKDFLNGQELSIFIPTLDLISHEALRIVNSYKEKNPDVRIDSLILSGGSAKMDGIDKYFTKSVGIKAVIGNPWNKIVINEKIKPMIENFGGAYSVAIGLAVRGIEEYRRN
jgi:type IV pilus assembly protein PilM